MFALAVMGLLGAEASGLAQQPALVVPPPVVFWNSPPAATPHDGLIYYGGPMWSRYSVPSPFPAGPQPYFTYHPYYPGYYTSGYYSNYRFMNPERHRASPYGLYSLGPR
jgi:hypothetical protein